MGKYILYSHAGSENHGCEALLRTSVMTLKDVEAVYTDSIQADKKYDLDQIVELRESKNEAFDNIWDRILYKIKYHLYSNDKIYYYHLYREFIQNIDSTKMYVSIGGDNYCYHFSEWLQVLNKEINRNNAKTILWGCSINADEFEDQEVVDDLEKYYLITARETLTYNMLKKKLKKPIIKYVPDTAFLLPIIEKKLPAGFEDGNTIGLNFSPVATKNAYAGQKLLDYMIELVNYIIDTTSYQIALIPHVVIEGNDDREVLREIQKRCKDFSRTVLIEDDNCMVIKGYISRCKLFIGARTHATIAAYSTLVPTIVLGYSIKARGIAKDLFGTEEKYVLPVQKIASGKELIESFLWLNMHKDEIREHLSKIMPEYKEKISTGMSYLEEFNETEI